MSQELQEITGNLLRCNKCGFCLAGCPIYKVTGIEWAAARGKLSLLGSVMDNVLAIQDIAEPLSLCLTCNCCSDHCPSGTHRMPGNHSAGPWTGRKPVCRHLLDGCGPHSRPGMASVRRCPLRGRNRDGIRLSHRSGCTP